MKNLKEIFVKDTIVDFKWKDKFYEKALKDGDIDRDFVDSASLKVVKDVQDGSYNDGYIAGAATVGLCVAAALSTLGTLFVLNKIEKKKEKKLEEALKDESE